MPPDDGTTMLPLSPHDPEPAPTPAIQTPNGDAGLFIPGLDWGGTEGNVVGIGSFHKSLPHNQFGEVKPSAYADLTAIIAGTAHGGDFEQVAFGPVHDPHHAPYAATARLPAGSPTPVDKLVSPQAGRAREGLGPDPIAMAMPPAPGVRSVSTAAEMTELFWMALLRDTPFDALQNPATVIGAVDELQAMFTAAVADTTDDGRLLPGLDLPKDAAGQVDIRPATLFRSGLKHEQHGPLVSQFFLHDAPYGTQTIVQKQVPYRRGLDFLTDHGSWLRAQNAGYDSFGDPYPMANDATDRADYLETEADGTRSFRRIATMRDLARFVHKDALHQAYFNAALLLLDWRADIDAGNPTKAYRRQRGFATLGGPHLLTLVSEVASRALKVVWRQKWMVHLRLRPEAYGGLMQMQMDGYQGITRDYDLRPEVFTTAAAQAVRGRAAGTWFLPMAFSSGSPIHPAYGAGHACVAGACVTMLKAWFNEDQKLATLLAANRPTHPLTGAPVRIVQPGLATGTVPDGSGGFELPDYTGADAAAMTVGGELNKIASNVAMGRSMGGVHWRSDNTRSLRLGEQVSAFILCRVTRELAEAPSVGFTSFNGHAISIAGGEVRKDGVLVDPVTEML